jgi:hypothetical protein
MKDVAENFYGGYGDEPRKFMLRYSIVTLGFFLVCFKKVLFASVCLFFAVHTITLLH